ncbi:MAG: M28 family peptidase [Bacteroidales bacterium]|nr:M28 family peptidase [Bacteroidales bacterium]
MKYTSILLLAASMTMSFVACRQTNNPSVAQKSVKMPVADISFSADSALRYVVEQTSFGPRVPGSDAHSRCLDYFKASFARFGAEVEVQEGSAKAFDGKMLPVRNVIAKYNKEKANRIILCSHWDSRPFADHDADSQYHNKPIDGANDGASGVGVLMEVARQFQVRKPDIGVDIILFDTEDCGTPDHLRLDNYVPDSWCLGSQFWGNSDMGRDSQARYGILLDMVGAPGAQFFQEGFSKQAAQSVVDKVWKAARNIGYGNYFVNDDGGYITDDHYYVNKLAKVPCIDIIQYDPLTSSGFYEHWHTHNDVVQNIDKNTLEVVGRTLLYVVYNE